METMQSSVNPFQWAVRFSSVSWKLALVGACCCIVLFFQSALAESGPTSLESKSSYIGSSHQVEPGAASILAAETLQSVTVVNDGIIADVNESEQGLTRGDDFPKTFIQASLVFASLLPLDAGSQVDVTQMLVLEEDFSGSLDLFPLAEIQMGIRLQNRDPQLANYVTVKSAGPGSAFRSDMTLRSELLASDQQPVPFFRLRDGTLYKGDQIEIEYHNLQLPRISELSFELPVLMRINPQALALPEPELFVDRTGYTDKVEAEPRWQRLYGENRKIRSGEAVIVKVIAPQLVKTGAPFQSFIELLDQYGNPASGTLPSFDILLDGSFITRADSSDSSTAIVRIPEQVIRTPGLHTVSVRSTGGGLRGLSPLMLASDAPPFKLQWTDFSIQSLARLSESAPNRSPAPLMGVNPVSLPADIPVEIGMNADVVRHLSYKGITTGGSWLELNNASVRTAMLLAELTGDRRRSSTGLIQLLAGPSGHEWLLAHYAQRGSTFGLAATRMALQSRRRTPGPATAILLRSEETWFQALNKGRTYVSNGSKAIVLWELNGSDPGSRVENSSRRQLSAVIYSDVPVVQLDWLKNSQPLVSALSQPISDKQESPENVVGPTAEPRRLWLNISLSSSSKPAKPGLSLPRNGREWLGYIKLTGLELLNFSAPGFDSVSDTAIAINPNDPNRIDFLGWTHGSSISFRVRVEVPVDTQLTISDLGRQQGQPEITPAATGTVELDEARLQVEKKQPDLLSIEMHIRDGFEDVLFLPAEREPSATPGLNEIIALGMIRAEPFRRDLIANGYRDKVTVSIEPELEAQSYSFEYTDTLDLLPGDYYYARIRLANGDFIWTSPIFVGGFDEILTGS